MPRLGGSMQGYNCIMVFHQEKNKLLFCKRLKDPYQGLYNLVGGKIESGEDGFAAAYRELEEETGIGIDKIRLAHMMDFTYYNQDCYVEVYVGYLEEEVELQDEDHPLVWLSISEDFFDYNRFAGEGNIGHMVEQVKCFGIGMMNNRCDALAEEILMIPENINGNDYMLLTNDKDKDSMLSRNAADIDRMLERNDMDKKSLISRIEIDNSSVCIGVDGCKGGWIAAILDHGKLILKKYTWLQDIISMYPEFDEFLIDMVIGLQSSTEHIRPDSYARSLIKERTSTIFPAPCRQAVYASSVSEAYQENERVLGKKFTPLTVGILPKMREVDVFLQKHSEFKNVIKESHPEVCFAKLNGKTVLSKKSEMDGIEERIQILTPYIKELSLAKLLYVAKDFRCNVDDVIDAICLAVTANYVYHDKFMLLPEAPMEDETGLLMQMVIPRT